MIAQTPLDGHPAPLASHASTEPPPPPEVFDQHAQQGWNFFTKFLFWNVITVVVCLIAVGLLTVWS
jgi:hypothetical protein